MEKIIYRTEGIVEEKISKKLYLVNIGGGIIRRVQLSSKLRMHYKEIPINAMVHVELYTDENRVGIFLSATDFKVNGWNGWTDDHEPKMKIILGPT